MNKNIKLLVMTGMHRSGTTFAGKVVAVTKGIDYIHEPFNYQYGCMGIPFVYPYINENKTRDEQIDKIIHEILNYKCRFKNIVKGESGLKSFIRRYVGGRGSLDLLSLKFKRIISKHKLGGSLLLKDPFVMLISPYLVKYYDAKIVILIRHPSAIWQSINRMNWTFTFDDFAGDDFWNNLDDKNIDKEYLNSCSEVIKISYLWKFLYRNVLYWKEKYPENIELIFHESLCIDPVNNVKKIIKHYGFDMEEKHQLLIEKMTNGDNVDVKNKQLHNFVRNSNSLAWSWVNKISSNDEKIIKDITYEDVVKIYGYWKPESA